MQIRVKGTISSFIFRQFREYFWWYFGAILFLIATHYCQSTLPFLAKSLAEAISDDYTKVSLWQFIWLALAIVVCRTTSRLLFFTPARILERDVRFELMRRLEETTPLRYQSFSPGQIFSILFSDMQQIRALLGFALLQIGNVIVAVGVLVPKLYQFNPDLVLAYTPMIIAMILMGAITYSSQHHYRKVQDIQGDIQNFLVESYNGKRSIKNYQSERSFIDLFKNYCQEELSYFFKGSRAPAVAIPLIPLSVAVSFVWGSHLIFVNDLGASSIILLSGFIFLFLEPMMFVGWIGVVFTRSIGSWNRIKELVDSLDEANEDEVILHEQNDFTGKLNQTENLGLKIPFWAEKPIEVNVPEYEWLVFVGRTGCGKTTVLKRIAEVLKENHLQISYVAQEPFIYNDSLVANIFLGKKPNKLELNQAWRYLKLFGLDTLAEDEDQVFSMELGENGKRLSGGQCKRLALIRSLMSNAPYLVWDDPFSSVDYILEKQIVEQLKSDPLVQKKTFLLSSHRISTVRFCDQVILLEKDHGILEKGSTNTLLTQESKTNEYFQKQLV
jgi:ATP-binding cassette subfamily B protein